MLKRKYQLKYANFNEQTGRSTVIIQTPLGEFGASSQCLEEDKKYVSSFFGCEIAEYKAFIKYGNRQIVEQRKIVASLKHLYADMVKINKFNEHSAEAIFIRKRIESEERELNDKIAHLTAIKRNVRLIIEKRDVYTNELRAKENNLNE